MRVPLVRLRGPTVVAVDLIIDDAGDLLMEGQDLGEAPDRFFGSDDYGYTVRVRRADVPRLREALLREGPGVRPEHVARVPETAGEEDGLLLAQLVARFGASDRPTSEFMAWLEAAEIPFGFATL